MAEAKQQAGEKLSMHWVAMPAWPGLGETAVSFNKAVSSSQARAYFESRIPGGVSRIWPL